MHNRYLNTHIRHHSLSWFGTGTSIKSGGAMLVSWAISFIDLLIKVTIIVVFLDFVIYVLFYKHELSLIQRGKKSEKPLVFRSNNKMYIYMFAYTMCLCKNLYEIYSKLKDWKARYPQNIREQNN